MTVVCIAVDTYPHFDDIFPGIRFFQFSECCQGLVRVQIFSFSHDYSNTLKSNRKAMNRNLSNQKANPALKTKTGKNI